MVSTAVEKCLNLTHMLKVTADKSGNSSKYLTEEFVEATSEAWKLTSLTISGAEKRHGKKARWRTCIHEILDIMDFHRYSRRYWRQLYIMCVTSFRLIHWWRFYMLYNIMQIMLHVGERCTCDILGSCNLYSPCLIDTHSD